MKGKNHASKVRASQLAASGELAGQLMCEVCHVYAATQDILQAHVEGKAHKKKVASQGLREVDLRCDLCDVTSTDRDGHDRHMGGKRHKEKVEGPKPKPEPKIIDYDKQEGVKVEGNGVKVEGVKMEENPNGVKVE